MAFYGSLGDIDVGAISKVTSDNAVDVFVYDTRKDSDGGAWRKRTQHTSWYNETLNTATRGSRRDFPAVAVIVATTNTITIYDGDDPDMPMWMVFNQVNILSSWTGGGYLWLNGNTVNSSVSAMNGIITIGTKDDPNNNVCGLLRIFFLTEVGIINSPWNGNTRYTTLPISGRNTLQSYIQRNEGTAIVNSQVNDVAMTVLPNAPIDSATGLPIPTIAVATGGGTSIIRDDGTVVNITYGNFNVANFVHFTKDNKIATFTDSATGGARFYRIYEIPSSNLDGGAFNNMGVALRAYNGDAVAYNYPIRYYLLSNNVDTGNFYANALVYAKDGPVFGRNGRGIALIAEATNPVLGTVNGNLSASDGMVCGISSSVNTGWMHGDIKGAFLSDTSTASVTGTELITNGTFTSNVSGWTNDTGTGTLDTQRIRVTANVNGTNGYVYQSFSTIAGKKYVLKADIILGSNTNNLFLGSVATAANIYEAGWAASSRSVRVEFTALTSTTFITLASHPSTTGFALFDNISVKRIEEDRSVNGKGLEVIGTITKSAVATGADLVAYGGWNSSNYLLQPSATAVGTSNFSLSFWIRPQTINAGSGGYLHLFSMGTTTTTGQLSATGFVFKMTTASAGAISNGYIPYFYSGGTTDFGTYNANNYFPLGAWSHCVAGRNGGVFYMYINGRLVQTGSANSTNFTDTYLSIGYPINNFTNEQGGDALVSLLRYSLSFPSPEQILKMYNDEKALFQENSKAVLFGSSDAVTALAYDDTTKLLSVGTSSGRSDFQGLERINNTTTAVTTAISASNGLIAEQ